MGGSTGPDEIAQKGYISKLQHCHICYYDVDIFSILKNTSKSKSRNPDQVIKTFWFEYVWMFKLHLKLQPMTNGSLSLIEQHLVSSSDSIFKIQHQNSKNISKDIWVWKSQIALFIFLKTRNLKNQQRPDDRMIGFQVNQTKKKNFETENIMRDSVKIWQLIKILKQKSLMEKNP